MAQQNLIVPINVQALCIGRPDTNNQVFAKPHINFSDLPYSDDGTSEGIRKPNLSERILTQPFTNGNTKEKGIYLHWALPEALTCGQAKTSNECSQIDKSNGLSFPLTPNRWLVTRITDGKASKSWVVESDYLSSDYRNTITVPDENILSTVDANNQPFNYLGRILNADQWNEDPTANRYDKLTAIGYGNLSFASFYPNCSSVFGFYDNVADLSKKSSLAYSVIGWYSNKDHDFLQKHLKEISAKDDWLNKLRWFIKDPQFLSTDSLSLYSGIIKNIDWNENEPYLNDSKTLIQTTVLASTELEALAAFLVHHKDKKQLLKKTDNEERKRLKLNQEYNLHLAQIGALKDPQTPKSHDQIARILHKNRFKERDGGIAYSLIKKDLLLQKEKEVEVTILPIEINEKLLALNQAQRNYEQLIFTLESIKWRVFTIWCNYLVTFHSAEIDKQKLGRKFYEFLPYEINPYVDEEEKKSNVEQDLEKAKKILEHSKKAFEDAINVENTQLMRQNQDYQWEPITIPSPKYYEPYDPMLLIGSDVSTPWQYAGERNQSNNSAGKLKCRLSSQIISPSTDANKAKWAKEKKLLEEIDLLLDEAILLSQGITGTVETNPESIANQKWQGTPFLIHHLEWEAAYYPLLVNSKTRMGEYNAAHLNNRFTLKDEVEELVPVSSFKPEDFKDKNPPIGYAIPTYSGYSLLTPSAKFNLKERIKEYQSFFKDEGLDPSILEKLSDLPILSQALNGFNSALLMQHKAAQLPIKDPYASEGERSLIKTTKDFIENANQLSPLPQNHFNPILDGVVNITKIRVVDCFGRFQEIFNPILTYPSEMEQVTFPQDISSGGQKDVTSARLYTRLLQPSRFSFRILSAKDKTIAYETNFHPDTNPIYGWILPNNLEQGIALFDQEGIPIGSLKKGSEKVIWESAPGLYDFGTDFENTFTLLKKEASDNLNAIQFLYDFAQSLKSLELKNFEAFLAAINNSIVNIEPKGYASAYSNIFLLGTPLALIQATIQLELHGLPIVKSNQTSLEHYLNDLKKDVEEWARKWPNTWPTDNFTDVEFPITIGDYHDFEDGVVGYFMRNEQAQLDYKEFYAVSEEDNNGPSHFVKRSIFSVTPSYYKADNTKNLLLLVDPRANITVKSGILPTKQIKIPESLYVKALQNIYITFLTTPIITDNLENQMIIPVSKDDGSQWSWIEVSRTEVCDKSEWVEKDILQPQGIFSNPQKIAEGWMKLKRTK